MRNFPADAPGRDAADLTRRLSQMVVVGSIAEVDHARARYRVKAGNQVTGWLPMQALRAGGQARSWEAPQVGEQVMVLSPSGDTRQGVILRGSIYQDAHGQPESNADVDLVQHADGARMSYDRASHTYTVDVPAGGAIRFVIGASEILMTEDGIKIRGNRLDLNDDR